MTGAGGRRVLFVLRGRLGDTVVGYATVRAWADAFPQDDVTLLIRTNYLPLFAREPGIRVLGAGRGLSMRLRAARLRLFEPAFDALMVLLGSGPEIEILGRTLRAARKLFLDRRYGPVFPEWPEIPPDHIHSEPAWRVAALCEPSLVQPRRSQIPSLAALRRPGNAVGIAPASDEARRTLGPAALGRLIAALKSRHPGREIHVLVNPADALARPLRAAGLPGGARFVEFPTLDALIAELALLEHLYSTDTGLHHLACAAGVPTTTFFGPTQPWKNSFPDQPELTRVRLAGLGGAHCEIKDCAHPVCLEHAVALHAGTTPPASLAPVPRDCPLRGCAPESLERLAPPPAARAVPVH